MKRKLLNVTEASQLLSLSRGCLRAWILQRRIAVIRLGRAVRIPTSEIDRLIQSGTVPARVSRRAR